jgi:hypothetical protein
MVSKIISAPVHVNTNGITQATVFTTACALMLSKETQADDIVFSRVVSGRHSLPIECQDVVGRCANVVPVRVRLSKENDMQDLLSAVQDQYLSSLPFETLGFDDIKENCTDWSADTTIYGVRTAYQNFNREFQSQVQDERLQLKGLPKENSQSALPMSDSGNSTLERAIVNSSPLYDVDIMAFPEVGGPHLRVSVLVNQRLCELTAVDRMVENLCESILTINSALKVATNCVRGPD